MIPASFRGSDDLLAQPRSSKRPRRNRKKLSGPSPSASASPSEEEEDDPALREALRQSLLEHPITRELCTRCVCPRFRRRHLLHSHDS